MTSKGDTVNIPIPAELAAAAAAHNVDAETVAVTAIADAIETAVIVAADERTNVERRTALGTVTAALSPARELVRDRKTAAADEIKPPTRR